MRSASNLSSGIAFAAGALAAGAALPALACQRIVGIDDVHLVDASMRSVDGADDLDGTGGRDATDGVDAEGRSDAGCAPVAIDAVCTDSCQCPIEAMCRLQSDTDLQRSCCRQSIAKTGDSCGSNCECVSGSCNDADGVCR